MSITSQYLKAGGGPNIGGSGTQNYLGQTVLNPIVSSEYETMIDDVEGLVIVTSTYTTAIT